MEKGRNPHVTLRRANSAEAISALKKAIEAYERIFDSSGAAQAYHELGNEYRHHWKYQDCFDAYERAHKWCERTATDSERRRIQRIPGELPSFIGFLRHEMGDREPIYELLKLVPFQFDEFRAGYDRMR